jgi:hypothetical protein
MKKEDKIQMAIYWMKSFCLTDPATYGVPLKALQKWIPKKVKYKDAGYDPMRDVNIYSCDCPDCGLSIIAFTDDDVSGFCNSDDPEEMFFSSMDPHGYQGLNNFCNRCGRKLRWR